MSDERLEESLQEHLAEVGGVGTDLQLVSPRPWAVPTGDRREALVMTITQQVNDMIARVREAAPGPLRRRRRAAAGGRC